MSYLICLLLTVIFLCWCITKFRLHVLFPKKVLFLLLALFLGVRYQVGVDYPTYKEIYDHPNSVHAMALEPIWLQFNALLRNVGFASRSFFFLTSLAIMYGYYVGMRKLSLNYYISILLFVLCGFYFETANTVRQCVAASILFAAFPLYQENKMWKYAACVLIAAMFHYSVVIIAPLLFLGRLKYKRWFLLLGVFVSCFWGNAILNTLFARIFPILHAIGKYQYELDDFDTGVDSGVLKIFYNLLGLFVLALYPRLLRKYPQTRILINFFVFGLILYNTCYLFMPGRRLYFYFFPYFVLLFPYCLNLFQRHSRVIVGWSICGCFLLFLLKSFWSVPYDFDLLFF